MPFSSWSLVPAHMCPTRLLLVGLRKKFVHPFGMEFMLNSSGESPSNVAVHMKGGDETFGERIRDALGCLSNGFIIRKVLL